MWPSKSEMFTLWFFTEKVCRSLRNHGQPNELQIQSQLAHGTLFQFQAAECLVPDGHKWSNQLPQSYLYFLAYFAIKSSPVT